MGFFFLPSRCLMLLLMLSMLRIKVMLILMLVHVMLARYGTVIIMG